MAGRPVVSRVKRDRSDDLPAFSGKVWRQRHKLSEARGARFTGSIGALGCLSHSDDVTAGVFDAYAAARLNWHLRRGERGVALSQVQTARKKLDVVLAALSEYRAALAGRIGVDRVRLIAARLDPARFIRDEIWPEVIRQALSADRDRLDQLVAALDGRGRSSTRLRVFAEEVLPIFREHVQADRQSRPGFMAFLAACCALVAGQLPGPAVLRRVAREVHK